MADDNRPLKYMRYAIGEIVLVVIGILIALAINNWNEERNNREKFDLTLVEIEKELISNINSAKNTISSLSTSDSLLLKILFDKLDIEDYQDNSRYDLVSVAYFYDLAAIKDNSFKKLIHTNGLTLEQESILEDLNDLYGYTKDVLDKQGNYMMEVHKSNIKTIKKYDWFKNWVSRSVDDDLINSYFLSDPEYFNSAIDFFAVFSDYRYTLEEYDTKAVSVYKKIYTLLDRHEIVHSDSLLYQNDPNTYKHYLGKYDSTWSNDETYVHNDSIVVSLENNKLIYTGHRSDGPDIRMEIIPVNKYLFRTKRGGFYHLSFDDKDQVEGIRFSSGPNWILDMKKVR